MNNFRGHFSGKINNEELKKKISEIMNNLLF